MEGRPTARHPGDVARVVTGSALLLVSLLAVQRETLTTFETDLFRLFNRLPSHLSTVLDPVMQFGNVVAAPIVAVVLLVVLRAHRRVAIDVTVAGFLAWFGAKAVKGVIERPRPGGLVEEVNRITSAEGLGFVSGHTAVAAAIATAAAPYLSRRGRRLIWLLPWVVGIGRMYFGAHLPLDIIGGAALGWVLGSLLHLLFGAPHRVPDLEEAAAALERAGVRPTALHRVPGAPVGSFPFVADVEGTPVFVKLLDPEPRDRDWIHRAARFLTVRDVRDEAAMPDATTQAHREAAMTLLARSGGARVPAVLAVEAADDRVWITQEHVPGTTFGALPPARVDERLLDAVWEQLLLLRGSQLAHRDLVGSNIIVDPDGAPWVVDFAHAEVTRRSRPLDNDAAELLVTTALVVGAERAVAAARRVMGGAALVALAPELQPLVLTAEARRQLRARPGLLDELHHLATASVRPVAAAPATGSRWSAVVVPAAWVASVVALAVVAGPDDTVDAIATPGWRWLGLAVLAAVVAALSSAVGLLAAIDRRMALLRSVAVVLRARRSRITRGRRRATHVLRACLREVGVPDDETDTGRSRLTRAGSAVVVVVGVVAGWAAWVAPVTADVPDDIWWLAVIAGAALAVEVAGPDRRTDRTGPRFEAGTVEPLRGPDVVKLGAAVLVEQAAAAIVTVAVVEAMGGGAPIAGIILVHAAVAALGFLLPAAGGAGASTVALTGGLAAIGVASPAALAAGVLVHLGRGLALPAIATCGWWVRGR